MIISQLVLENILSHRGTELNLDSGLNVIVGESGCGKTAVSRAVNWLLLGDEHVEGLLSSGSTCCRVTASSRDGILLSREWDREHEVYAVAGPGEEPRFYHLEHGAIPPAVRTVHGVSASRLGPDLKVCLQVPRPAEDLFLVNEPVAVKAIALGSLQGVLAADAALNDLHAVTQDAPGDAALSGTDFKSEALNLIVQSIRNARRMAKEELERFVTSALRSTFCSDFEFVIHFEPDHGAEFMIRSRTKDGSLLLPVTAFGSGVTEFVALALRVAFTVTAHPPLKGPIVFDEPVPAVSNQYISNVGRFMKSTADGYGVQIILLTGNQRITGSADSVNVLWLEGGVTHVQHRGGSIRAKSGAR